MQTRMLWKMGMAVLLVGVAPPVWAQGAAAPASAPAQTQPPPAARATGRRDPFRTIVVKRGEEAPTCNFPGLRSLLIGQIQVQGIARGISGERIAVVDNNTKRAYFLREKDEVCNGTVTRIAAEGVTFAEQIRDASGRTQTREVVRPLAQQTGRRPAAARPR